MIKKDVIIIGAGPAGLSAATYLARSAYSSLVLDKDAPGGRLNTLPLIENYPGFKAISGAELASSFLDAATSLGVEVSYGNVISISKEGDLFLTKTDIDTYESRAVIVASGITFIPSIKGEKEFLGKGVSYCATCDGRFFKDKVMAVFGNGNEALQEALYLAPLSSSLIFICPKTIEGDQKKIQILKESKNVSLIENAILERIEGNEKVTGVIVNQKEIKVDAVFPLNGPKSASGFLASLNVELNKNFIKTNGEQETSCLGLFAAGDVVNKKLRQVVTAASEGAIAASNCIQYLNSKRK